MSRLLIVVLLLFSSGCVTGGAERWQRTRDTREEMRVSVHESAVEVQHDGDRLEVTAYERTLAESRSLRTYERMREVYRIGGDLDELVYGLLWGVAYCTGVGPVYDIISTVGGKHAFPGLRTLVFGLLPGVHDATVRGLIEDHRIAAEEATGERVERAEGPWVPVGELAWRPIADKTLEVRCGEHVVGRARTDDNGHARLESTRHPCSSGARCSQLAVLVEGSALTRVEALGPLPLSIASVSKAGS
ncbi:MAG: hypothetical protein ACYS22_19280 [Planctomycetota bacterium]|jgi:hypothetical protein